MCDKINVLVVEDSPLAQLLLVHILQSHPRINVIGTANDGQEALAFVEQHTADVIVMDIHLPGIDGYETTRRIMETRPVPIVVCSASFSPGEVADTFRAMEAGAVAVVPKPVGVGHHHYESMAAKLVETVTLMSEVKVVRRWSKSRMRAPVDYSPPARLKSSTGEVSIVAMGASTGGPPVLQTILSGLPQELRVPILIVQHIAPGFLRGLAEWLGETTGKPICIATHRQEPRPGHVYLAPDGYHMGLDAGGHIELSRQLPENGLRPSVSYLFRSVAEVHGADAAAVLLTGMGRDGADELKRLNALGAVTIAQDAASSVVHGMPGEAIKIGAADYVLSPDQIAIKVAAMAADTSVKRA